MTVVDFVRLTRANAAVIFVMFSLGLIAAFLYTVRQPVVFTACSQGTVVVANDGSVSGIFSANSLAMQKLSTYAGLATSTNVADDVVKKLGLQATPGEIAGRFSAAPASDRPVLNICASGPSPVGARDLANAVIGAMSKEAARLESAALPAGAATSSLIRLVPTEQAGVPGAPSSPNYPRNLLAGAVAGVLAGYVVSLIRRQLDRKVRSVDDVETLIGTSVLSIVPESTELDRHDSLGFVQTQSSAAAEALRQLRTNLRFVDVDNPPQSIVVTSANAGEGKSVLAANLARVLAAAGQPTVLVDGDLRRPMVATMFDLDPTVGLTQVLAGDVPLHDVVVDPGVPNLRVVVSGRIPPNPSELLGSQRMQALIRELVDDGYHVLIDAPPLLPVTDAGLLAGTVDGVLLVLAVGRTFKEQAQLAAKVIGQVGGHVLGTVFNRAPLKGIGSVVYGYGYSTYGSDYYGAYVARDGAGAGGGLRQRRRDRQRQRRTEETVRRQPEPLPPPPPGVVPFRTADARAAESRPAAPGSEAGAQATDRDQDPAAEPKPRARGKRAPREKSGSVASADQDPAAYGRAPTKPRAGSRRAAGPATGPFSAGQTKPNRRSGSD